MVWSDEFNDFILNDSKWKCDLGNSNGWGNNELEYYTGNSKNVFLRYGNLVITAEKEDFQGFKYTSARIHTRMSWLYGKIEAKIILPYGQGIWPAFWMVRWPDSGEIDIMEMIGGKGRENTVYGTAHWYSNGDFEYSKYFRLPSGNFSDSFHVFDVEWDSQKIIWHVDGIQYNRLDLNSSMSDFNFPFFIVLNLAVGGSWPGYPDANTVFPQTMMVDYVRVYQRTTGINDDAQMNSNFSIDQNYPNPFNPSTQINYQLPRSEKVSLKIYDVFGKEAANLVDEFKPAGKYSVNFNAQDCGLTSGVYFYQLIAGTFSKTRKMILIK